jgi:hypothetical protein
VKGTRVAHPARLAARVRLLLAGQDYFDVHTPTVQVEDAAALGMYPQEIFLDACFMCVI